MATNRYHERTSAGRNYKSHILLSWAVVVVLWVADALASDVDLGGDDNHSDPSIGIDIEASDAASSSSSSSSSDWSWERILTSSLAEGGRIVANGNVYPPLPDESPTDCLILVSHHQLTYHCPDGDERSHERQTVLYRQDHDGRLCGVVSAPGTDRRRLWMFDSHRKHQSLLELDTVTGEIVQTLAFDDEGTIDGGYMDGHDAVRVDGSIFLVDTRNGRVLEIDLPASAPPYAESSVEAGASAARVEGYVNVAKRHGGFTRKDHVNNVAVHPDLLIGSLHGGDALSKRVKSMDDGQGRSPTRLSALSRSASEEDGRELTPEADGFASVENVGTWCHGIAFWEDNESGRDDNNSRRAIKLVMLDSKEGSLVTVVLVGENPGERRVLWEPDPSRHPVLVPPPGVAAAYNNGARVFAKGMAVQGGVAYFAVSYARSPVLRRTVPESLFVAVDLASGRELWARTVRSNGLVNQVVTVGHLGWRPRLPAEPSTVEVTPHGPGGRMVKSCTNRSPQGELNDDLCKEFEGDNKLKCRSDESGKARTACCACGGGERQQVPLMAGALDGEVLKIEENVTHTATFLKNDACLDETGNTKKIELSAKAKANIPLIQIQSLDKHLPSILRHVCNLDVGPIAERLMELGGDAVFTEEYQKINGNAIIKQNTNINDFKPGTKEIWLIFSSKDASKVYHLPFLDDWLEMLREKVLEPTGIRPDSIIRMMFANMPEGSTINIHRDQNNWVQTSHRVHVPIVTHPDVFFLTQSGREPGKSQRGKKRGENDEGEDPLRIMRIKSEAGEVYEFNNAMAHGVRNLGRSRVHLILDWKEDITDEEGNPAFTMVKLQPGEECERVKGQLDLVCTRDLEDSGAREEL